MRRIRSECPSFAVCMFFPPSPAVRRRGAASLPLHGPGQCSARLRLPETGGSRKKTARKKCAASTRRDHLAPGRGIFGILLRHAEEELAATDDLTQVDVLDGIVRGGEAEGTARAVQSRVLQRRDELALRAGVSLDLVERLREEIDRVVALDGIHVGLAGIGLL